MRPSGSSFRSAPRSSMMPLTTDAASLLPGPHDCSKQAACRLHSTAEREPGGAALQCASEIGLLQLCHHCAEYWPADPEFFQRDPRRPLGIEHTCKACRKEQRSAVTGYASR